MWVAAACSTRQPRATSWIGLTIGARPLVATDDWGGWPWDPSGEVGGVGRCRALRVWMHGVVAVITPPGHRHPAQDPGAGAELHRLSPDPGHPEHVVVDTRLGGTGPRRPRRTAAEELVAHFAVPMAGGVLVTLVTLNTRLSPAEIAHIVETVRRYLRAGSVDTLLAGGVRASVLDSFRPYLHDRRR